MRKITARRIRQSVVASVVGVTCIFFCGNLETTFAETATVTDATAGDATVGDAGQNIDIQSEGVMTIGDAVVQTDARETDATQTDAAGTVATGKDSKIDGISVLNAQEAGLQVSSKKYEGEYHIDYILSHCSYFVQSDLEGDTVADTVGTIIVGNRLNLKNSVGKVKAAASYARYLIDLNDYPVDSWNDTTGIDTNFYYTESYLSYKDWLTNRMVKVADNYINMDEAFAVIKQESQALEKAGQAGYEEQGNLIIDFSNSRTITVSGEQFSSARRVILKNVTAEDIFSNAYTISVSGDGDYALDTSKIEIGGTALNNNFFLNLAKNRPGGVQGGQYYNGGFGLVWNFPDAKNITANFLTGHIIAPSGNVSLIGGNHEGQVIAQNVKSSSESHFYPYNVTTTETTTTETTTAEATTTERTTTETTTTEATTTESTTTETTTAETATTERTTTEKATTETVTTESTTTETATTEAVTTAEGTAITEETTTENVITTRATLIVSPKASSTSRPVPETEIWAETDEVRTGDSMALGIVVTLLVASAGGVLLFAVLHEHKKK